MILFYTFTQYYCRIHFYCNNKLYFIKKKYTRRGQKSSEIVFCQFLTFLLKYLFVCSIQGVSAKTFVPNNSVIFQGIFVKFKMQIF
jgi:hypothetical protein